MSPRHLREYRAERLLRDEFDSQRRRVCGAVRSRLRGRGVTLDEADLAACYSQAWQGLYGAVLEGAEIERPVAWLMVATFRRAIDEHRARLRTPAPSPGADCAQGDELAYAPERDLAEELDDRERLRALLEGMSARLDARELEAATLCYLHGYTREMARERLGLSVRGMRRLMEGRSPARPGVAGKIGAIAQAIAEGSWCDEQGSLMRAFAYGVLDPDGERHRLAQIHHAACPACRAYVRSLRGLAVVLPPVLSPLALGMGIGGGAGAGAHALGANVASGLSGASGAAGSSSALGGVAAGKLAAACVLALSVGAGCVALGVGGGRDAAHAPGGAHALTYPGAAPAHTDDRRAGRLEVTVTSPPPGAAAATPPHGRVPAAATLITREFSPEAGNAAPPAPLARTASDGHAAVPAGDSGAALREFSPG